MTNGPVGVMTEQSDHREAAATPDRRVAVVHPALFNPSPLPIVRNESRRLRLREFQDKPSWPPPNPDSRRSLNISCCRGCNTLRRISPRLP